MNNDSNDLLNGLEEVPRQKVEVPRPITTSFVQWMMIMEITVKDVEDIFLCLKEIGSQHGRFCAKMQCTDTGSEIRLWEVDGRRDILRLANAKAVGKFQCVLRDAVQLF